MADGIPATLKVLRAELAALDTYLRAEVAHMQTALGDVLRDLDDIKSRLPVRKADKRRDAARTNR
jgi:hypothetical protein